MSRLYAPVFLLAVLAPLSAEPPRALKVLFLGDNGHHRPAERYRQLQPVLAARGIDLVYTDKVDALNPKVLASYDALAVYANIEKIGPEQEKALLDFVEGGKGLVALHCASYCFLNSPKYVALVGAQFKSHGTGVFRTTLAEPGHPILRGFGGFESWDETYVHDKHNDKDRTVLEHRTDGARKEPWTWVRTQGKGRVFYTAWGHDERTWGNPGFHNLVERGIRWAGGDDPGRVPAFADHPEMTAKRTDVKPFEYVDATIPYYPPGQGWGKTAEPIRKMQKPLDPAESLKHVVVPVGFEVKLFASEAQLGGKPICMNWDERGRLWAAVTRDYPNDRQPEGKGHDRIVVCEDTDGDGAADKFTVFADKLSIPTSLTFARGGVLVHQAPHTLFLKDTDGDGVADEQRVLFTGWSTGDTHAGPSNLRQGLDNWIYGMVGYAGYEGVVGGEKVRFSQGFYRFRPDGSRLEFLRNTNNNSWGVGFSEEGLLFGSTANGNPSVHLPIPNRYYESVRGWSASVLPGIAGNAPMYPITDRVRQVDWHGHFTAAAGHALYTARTYPREYWNRTAFVTEPTGHLVATFALTPAGGTFTSRNAWNLLASDDEWTAPVAAEVGPDGNVWVIDWYNYIVQHNPTPPGYKTGKGNAYETDLRDKKHGRIYRIVYKNARPTSPFSLKDATPEKLVATLKHDNMLWRLHAQRLLVERGNKDVVPALVKMAEDERVDEIGLNAGVVHALWTLHGLGALDGSDAKAAGAATRALRHASAGVRRNAALVLPRNQEGVQALVAAGLLADKDPQVRLAACLALAEMPQSDLAAEDVVHALARDANLADRWLTDALTSAAAAHDAAFLKAAARVGVPPLGGSSLPQPPKGGTPTPPSTALAAVVERVAEHHARGVPAATVASLLQALPAANETVAGAIVAGLARGWPAGKPPVLGPEAEKAIVALLPKLSPAARGRLLALAGRWGSKSLDKYAAAIAESFLAEAGDSKALDTDRIVAAGRVIELRKDDAATAAKVLDLLTPRTAPELAQGLLDAVGHSEAPAVGAAIVERLPALTPAVRPAALRILLARADWTEALLGALEKGRVQLVELSLDQKQALAAHPSKAVAERAKALLARGGGLPSPDREKVVQELLPLTKKKGDAAAGKVVFKNQCAKCHMHSGEGAKIGPDLTGVAVHPREHLLVDILDPSRSVEGNFRQYTVTTRSGRVLNGLLASETRTSIELLDAEGKRHAILREDIEDDGFQASTKSLMPEGFEKQVSATDLVNLLEFLTQRGKYLPLPLDKVATAVSTRGMFYSEDAPAERLIFSDWSPKVFEGVPFQLVDPRDGRVKNAVLLYGGPQGSLPRKMPRSVTLPCNAPAKAIHLLGGVSGWGSPLGTRGSVSLIVRLHYDDGKTEDHALKNGEHFADYIRRVDVPGSKFAFDLRGRQVRYLAIVPQRSAAIKEVELVKGPDATAPVVLAVTVEGP
jgi:putative membrane-bound dehydrogenase-like protein